MKTSCFAEVKPRNGVDSKRRKARMVARVKFLCFLRKYEEVCGPFLGFLNYWEVQEIAACEELLHCCEFLCGDCSVVNYCELLRGDCVVAG